MSIHCVICNREILVPCTNFGKESKTCSRECNATYQASRCTYNDDRKAYLKAYRARNKERQREHKRKFNEKDKPRKLEDRREKLKQGKACIECGQRFFPKNLALIACSDSCREARAKKASDEILAEKRGIKTCPVCGKEFAPAKGYRFAACPGHADWCKWARYRLNGLGWIESSREGGCEWAAKAHVLARGGRLVAEKTKIRAKQPGRDRPRTWDEAIQKMTIRGMASASSAQRLH